MIAAMSLILRCLGVLLMCYCAWDLEISLYFGVLIGAALMEASGWLVKSA